MTSRERMQTVLSGELPDRVPFFPTIYIDHACHACGHRFEEALIEPARGNEFMLEAALHYRTDVVRFVMGTPASWYADKTVREKDGRLIQYDTKTGKAEGCYDVQGGGSFIPYEKPAPVTTAADVEGIPVTPASEYVESGCLKAVVQAIDRAHEEELFTVAMVSRQTINFMVQQMGSAEAALTCFYDDPELARALIDKAVAISIEKGNAFVGAGIDCIYVGDSYASASVISPQTYREFCVPAYAKAAEAFHRMGVFCYKHCCGNYNPLLDDLPAVGLDAMDGIDPESGMTVERTKRAVGSQLTLMGGISCLNLLNGTPESVYEEARSCMEAGKPGGRYVLGTACAVPRFVPSDNLAAARRCVEDHGWYR